MPTVVSIMVIAEAVRLKAINVIVTALFGIVVLHLHSSSEVVRLNVGKDESTLPIPKPNRTVGECPKAR